MPDVDLNYGRAKITLEYDAERTLILGTSAGEPPLSDAEIGERLDSPIDSDTLENIIAPGGSVLIVVPDATRQTACGQVVNLVVRRLIAGGTMPHDIRIIFATGIHRKVTEDEKSALLTPFIAQRIKTLDHDPRDLARLVRLGETDTGIPIELDRALVEHDKVIIVGGVSFHYFAGFTGGRKLICPGLASTRTVAATHKLAFDCETLSRRDGVDTGLLDGNAVHESFIQVVESAAPAFAISTIVNDAGQAVEVFCGDWRSSHRAACDAYAAKQDVVIDEKRDLVIASCGGYPFDINLIQAHKTLEAASQACRDGGTLVLIAECPDGMGREDFLDWFTAASSDELARRLCEKYQVNGQTAWSLLRKTERFDVRMLTDIGDEAVGRMRAKTIGTVALQELIDTASAGFVIPNGSRVRILAEEKT